MLDELLGTWLDKRKAKKELYKAYKIYLKKKKPYLQVSTIDIYEQLQNVQYAIAYVLCKYFNVKNENNVSNITWSIYYDYQNHYDECKEAYEKLTKTNESKSTYDNNDILYTDLIDSDVLQSAINNNIHTIYDMKNNYLYWRDKYGNFFEKC